MKQITTVPEKILLYTRFEVERLDRDISTRK
uniref:Uncharacterized protein n=1 Tax=Arundo donax TaxID=35708 RepID=A0A0A9GEZ6_ARUDO